MFSKLRVQRILALALALIQTGLSQDAREREAGPPRKLSIAVIEGEGAVNNTKQRLAREVMVQVEDENRKPVAGVTLTFVLPRTGAGGNFVNGDKFITAVTDRSGRAKALFRTNSISGKFEIQVSGSHQGLNAAATIAQANIAAAAGAGISATAISIIAAVAAAGAAGAVVAVKNRGNSTGSAPSPSGAISVGGGGPVFGPPR